MNRWIANLLGLFAIGVCIALMWALLAWGQAGKALAASVSSLPTITAKLNQALDTVNHSCAPGPCGTLANVDKLTVKIGDLAVTSQRQVAQSSAIVTAAAANLNKAGDSVTELTGHLNKTADAATGLTVALTGDANEAKTTIATFPPLVAAYTQSGNDLDALLKDRAIHDTLTDLQVTTQNIGGIASDLRQVSDKETVEFLKPTPWWKWPFKRAGQFIDIGAAVARNIP